MTKSASDENREEWLKAIDQANQTRKKMQNSANFNLGGKDKEKATLTLRGTSKKTKPHGLCCMEAVGELPAYFRKCPDCPRPDDE